MSKRISETDRAPRRGPRGLIRSRSGATAVEFAIILPVLLLLTLGLWELTLVLYNYHRAGEAMRMAARGFVIDPPVTSYSGMPINCPTDADCDSAKLSAMVATLQNVIPSFTGPNLQVVVADSGLTDPANPGIVNPVLTVNLVGLQHTFAVLSMVPGIPDSFTFPAFSTTRMAASQVP